MTDRTSLGVINSRNPTFSVPCPVEDFFWKLARRLPQNVKINVIGKGYHNAGWSYLEVEVIAQSPARAWDEAERLSNELMEEYHCS